MSMHRLCIALELEALYQLWCQGMRQKGLPTMERGIWCERFLEALEPPPGQVH